MFYSRRTLRSSVSLGVILSFLAGARAELVSTSPFLPPQQSQVIAAPVTPPNLEFKGISTMENVPVYLIFDASAARKKEFWLKLNEPGPGLVVRSYDPNADTVTVDYQGRPLTLPMKTPKVASSGLGVPPASVPVNLATQTITSTGVKLATVPTAAAPVTPNATSPEEAARMKEWTDEIEKRRNVRNAPAGTAPTPTPTPAPAASPAVGRSGQTAPGGR